MRRPCAMFTVAAVMVFALLCIGDNYAAEPNSAAPKPSTPAPNVTGAPAEESPSRIYEAVSGYLEGFRRKTDKAGKSEPSRDKYRPASGSSLNSDDEALRALFESENVLAKSRMQRGEWDLAALGLARAVSAGSQPVSATENEKLQQMLREARARAGRSSDAATPGEITNSVGMTFVRIPAGQFTMGTSSAEVRRLDGDWNTTLSMLEPEEPAHTVKISRPFLMGKHVVTVGQFKRFVNETGYRTTAETQGWGWAYDKEKNHWVKKSGACWHNPGTKVWDDLPVTLICHRDAEAFCQWLSNKEKRRYHLPTEAQWEYAARGGKEGQAFFWGNDYPDGRKLNLADRRAPVPWADRTIDDGHAGPAPVGSYEPNGFWLYDMAGNVWQLCSDYYDAKTYEKRASTVTTDPRGPDKGKTQVVRGGNWAFEALIARNAFRYGVAPDLCADTTGFRVAAILSVDEASVEQAPQAIAPKDLSADQEVSRLLDQVKSLTASGRRMEARRLVEKFYESASKSTVHSGDNPEVLKSVLESFIDITRDKSLESFTNSLGMKMVRISAGAFVMGSSELDIGWALSTLAREQPVSLENEMPFHKVRVSRPFFIAATPVTVAQFRTFVQETGYVTDAEDEGGGQVFNERDSTWERKAGSSWKDPGWKIEDNQPVTMMSWNDAQAFVDWLAAKEKLPYKLPTEAQWEFAARGGLPMNQFPWGDALPDGRRANYADKNTSFAWRDRNADDGYKYVGPVGTYEPNGFGLYDMAGNVLQWVRDHYGEDYYRFTPEIDPEGPGHGESRVMKGGSWAFGPVNLRCAFRGWARPELAMYNVGFRVAIELANSRRSCHFSNDFLTKEWVPGPDQREVAQAVSKEKELRASAGADSEKTGPGSIAKVDRTPALNGVKILDFTPKSDARKAGMAKGDVIVEYNGTRDLTVERLLALTAETRRRRDKALVVFVRDGHEYSARVNPGALGISVADTKIRGPFKTPDPKPQRSPDDDKKRRPLDWT